MTNTQKKLELIKNTKNSSAKFSIGKFWMCWVELDERIARIPVNVLSSSRFVVQVFCELFLTFDFLIFSGAVYEQRWLPKCLIYHIRFVRSRLSHSWSHRTNRDSQRGSQVRKLYKVFDADNYFHISQRKTMQSFAGKSRRLFMVISLQYITARIFAEFALPQNAQARKSNSHRHRGYRKKCK